MLTRLALTSHVYRARASQIALQCSGLPTCRNLLKGRVIIRSFDCV